MNRRELWVGAHTDVGRERDHNEDAFVCQPDLGIFAVIDGVGGERAGEIAARKATEILVSRLSRPTAPARQRLREAITLANNAIYDQARQDPAFKGMSCVLTAAVLEGERLSLGHVGDCRLYLLRPGEIVKVTHDHSLVGMMEERGEISEREAMHHPRRSEILRDVGSQRLELESPEFVDLDELHFGPGEAILLCSDGLTDQLTAGEILATVERLAGQAQSAAESLVRAANRAGGKDNVTVVLVEGERYPELARARRAPQPACEAGWERDPTGSVPATRPGARGVSGATGPLAAAPRNPVSPGGPRWVGGLPAAARTAGGRPADGRQRRLAVLSGRGVRLLFLLALLAALALLAPGVVERLASLVEHAGIVSGRGAPILRVGGEGATHASIGEALAAARPGQRIEVEPGIYDERLRLPGGVALVSAVPRQAVIRLSAGASLEEPIAVLAQGVRGARVEGFRIAGDAEHPLAVGIRLVDAAVVIENVAITGAREAAVEAVGGDQSLLAFSLVADNGGAGIILDGPAATRLLSNLIEGNGAGLEPPAAGVELRGGASPLLHDNRFAGNAAAALRGVDPSQVQELARRNRFEGEGPGSAIVPRTAEPGGEGGGAAPTGQPPAESER